MPKREQPADDEGTGTAAAPGGSSGQPAPEGARRTEPGQVGEREKRAALRRLRDAPDEQLAVFADRMRQDALAAGATEQELRDAQSGHPEHDW